MGVEHSCIIIVGREISEVDFGDCYDDLGKLYLLGLDKMIDSCYGGKTSEILGNVIFSIEVPETALFSFAYITEEVEQGKKDAEQTDELIKEKYPKLWDKLKDIPVETYIMGRIH